MTRYRMSLPEIALLLAIALLLCVGGTNLHAQAVPPKTDNAALRYWMAFALMQDPPADSATQTLLSDTAAGKVPWDEQRLGALVEQNREAVITMQRGTTLPDCNWGLDYELGPETPVAHVAKARVLARLNALYGMHQLSRHDSTGAVNTWLAGLRFSQHLDQGASLFGVLTANASLMAHLKVIKNAVESGALSDAEISRIDAAVRALPVYGFDWGEAVLVEAAATAIGFDQFAKSSDPSGLYLTDFGEQAPSNLAAPTAAQIAEYRTLMGKVAIAFRQNYSPLPELGTLEARIRKLNPVIDAALPNLSRLIEPRQEAARARQALLNAAANRRR